MAQALKVLALAGALPLSCSAPPELAPDVRPPGTLRMVDRLARLAENTAPDENPFLNDRRAAYLKSLELPADPGPRLAARFRLAQQLLLAGSTEEAIGILEELAEASSGASPPVSPEQAREYRTWLATAYLRLGEQENCQLSHSADSCLLPIRGEGVHQLERGSRAAVRVLTGLLEEDPDDLELRWLLNLAAMTLGEYPEGVPARWRIPPAAFASDHDVGRFFDRAPGLGLDVTGLAGGSVVEDFDGDGYLDVMASSWGPTDQLRLFRSRGDGTFEERTREAGLTGIVGGLNLVQADYDNDGRPDVLVLRGAWLYRAGRQPNSLLRNLGDGTFEDVTEEAGLLTFRPTQTAAWGDYDNDGWLDLYVGNESLPGSPNPCQLFRNQGDGTFTEVAADAGLAVEGFVKGVAWGDYDNDGWLDLYLSRFLEPNLLFRNQGASGRATFREVSAEAGVAEPLHSFPTWFFDYDNDGWQDLFVAAYPADYFAARAAPVVADVLGLPASVETLRLYRNAGDGTFRDVTAEVGLDHVLYTMGANFGDLDNDGWLDLYLGTGAPDLRVLVPNRMFRNAGGHAFQDVTSSGGFGHLQKGHGIAFADLDNDGDQDVYAVLGGAYSGDVYANALFENPGHGNRWVTLRLEGVEANRAAIGARLRLEVETRGGRRRIFATIGSGGSFGASSLQGEVGLGDATALPLVEIAWPGSGVQVLRDLPLDSILRVREGDPEPEVLHPERLDLAAGSRRPPHPAH